MFGWFILKRFAPHVMFLLAALLLYHMIRENAATEERQKLELIELREQIRISKEKKANDEKISNIPEGDLVDYGCKWLPRDDPEYCGD